MELSNKSESNDFMLKNGIRFITFALLFFSMIIAYFDYFKTSKNHSLFTAWILLPYIILFYIAVLSKRTLAMNWSLLISSFVMLFFTPLFYSDTTSSSTGCLIFLFGPFYMLVGIPVLIGLSYFVMKIILPSKEENKSVTSAKSVIKGKNAE